MTLFDRAATGGDFDESGCFVEVAGDCDDVLACSLGPSRDLLEVLEAQRESLEITFEVLLVVDGLAVACGPPLDALELAPRDHGTDHLGGLVEVSDGIESVGDAGECCSLLLVCEPIRVRDSLFEFSGAFDRLIAQLVGGLIDPLRRERPLGTGPLSRPFSVDGESGHCAERQRRSDQRYEDRGPSFHGVLLRSGFPTDSTMPDRCDADAMRMSAFCEIRPQGACHDQRSSVRCTA